MAVLWRVTVKKKYGTVASGMWIELLFQNNSQIPMQEDIRNALNAKYGKNTLNGTIPREFLEIVKL
ncbi:hypothetical protein [Riemerella anatipestifer]|nr:hypothetical protein [Riemerella anatipestifer]MDY3317136.1 hypothetical protein [Riemerella anatipestifer]MDY3328071.1 hypothetical protein [Riemerella anatipestifer]MDY3548139.1 hypothetical protein [Riemerella anatipestifer]OBP41262.1 hypothetical protein AWR41_07285 [Riemerella anatipestifer]